MPRQKRITRMLQITIRTSNEIQTIHAELTKQEFNTIRFLLKGMKTKTTSIRKPTQLMTESGKELIIPELEELRQEQIKHAEIMKYGAQA